MKGLSLGLAGLLAVLLAAGCSSSRVRFLEPAGTVLHLDVRRGQAAESYTFPVDLDLEQAEAPMSLPSDIGGRQIQLVLTDKSRLKGILPVYKINMDQVEKLAEITFQLAAEQIEKLKAGHAVTIIGYSARNRPVYKINLGLDRR